MRFLAILLSACVIILSSFGGMIKPVQPVKKDCCKKMAATACQHKTSQKDSNNCDDPYCTMIFSCSTCGFLVKECITVAPLKGTYLPKPVPLNKIGDLSAYHSSSWKPPQAC